MVKKKGSTVKDRANEGLGVLVDLLLRAVAAEDLVEFVQLARAAPRIVHRQLTLLADLAATCWQDTLPRHCHRKFCSH